MLVLFSLAAACVVFAIAYEEPEEEALPIRESFRITRAYAGSELELERVPLKALFS